jgi:magnesium chelatase accessory protein
MSGALNWENEGKDWPHRDSSRFVKAGGLRWHVQVAGQGPVMLLLHGTGASTHSWRGVLPLLAEHFTVVAPDLPGHGFTSSPATDGLSLPAMSRAVGALLTALEIKPMFVVGHSAGVAVALRMCLDGLIAPRSVVGINAALMPFGGMASQVFPVMAKLLVLNPFVPRFVAWRAEDKTAVTRLIEGTGSRLDATGLELYRRLFSARDHVAATLGMMANWQLEGLLRDMRKFTLPLTLIVGEADKAVPPEDARKIKRVVSHAAIVSMPRVGHLCHEEKPEDVTRIILDTCQTDTCQTDTCQSD